MVRRTVLGFLLSVLMSVSAWAEETLKIGDEAPKWAALAGVDDKLYSLDDFKQQTALVIVFTCNSCPYAVDYEDRLIAFAKEHCAKDEDGKADVALVAINANKVKEDLPEEMKKRAEKKGFNFPYVWDETQATARAHGANYTPEFYVFDRDRRLIYRGAMDDHTDPKQAKVNYVAEAVKAALAGGTPKVQETGAVGCAVRYEKRRRK